jgi:hypothetical protein
MKQRHPDILERAQLQRCRPELLALLPPRTSTISGKKKKIRQLLLQAICHSLRPTLSRAFLASSSAAWSSLAKGRLSAEYPCTVARLREQEYDQYGGLLNQIRLKRTYPARTNSTATFWPFEYMAPIKPPCLSTLSKTGRGKEVWFS